MSRGLFILVVQIAAGLGVMAIGMWALLRPRHLQQFIQSNFALLPGVKGPWQVTPRLLRLFGAFALWYGCMILGAFRQELAALEFG